MVSATPFHQNRSTPKSISARLPSCCAPVMFIAKQPVNRPEIQNQFIEPHMNRFLQWLPALLWAAVIFYFSSQAHAPHVSGKPGVQHVVQKFGHAIEYGILAILIFRPLRRTHRLPLRLALFLAVLLSGAYAASDEWHQSFVPGRSALFSDFAIDTTGATVAMLGFYANESRLRPKTNR